MVALGGWTDGLGGLGRERALFEDPLGPFLDGGLLLGLGECRVLHSPPTPLVRTIKGS